MFWKEESLDVLGTLAPLGAATQLLASIKSESALIKAYKYCKEIVNRVLPEIICHIRASFRCPYRKDRKKYVVAIEKKFFLRIQMKSCDVVTMVKKQPSLVILGNFGGTINQAPCPGVSGMADIVTLPAEIQRLIFGYLAEDERLESALALRLVSKRLKVSKLHKNYCLCDLNPDTFLYATDGN